MSSDKNTEKKCKPIIILLVEDNLADIRLTQEVFKDGKLCNEIKIARDGEEALDFLHRRDKFADAPLPDLILLDLNLPKKDGREVLSEIKDDPMLKYIPVVVLTTSKAEEDIIKSYSNYANCYVTKPIDLNQFMEIVRSIEVFWLKVVKLPLRNEDER